MYTLDEAEKLKRLFAMKRNFSGCEKQQKKKGIIYNKHYNVNHVNILQQT